MSPTTTASGEGTGPPAAQGSRGGGATRVVEPAPAALDGWDARLALRFERRDGCSLLAQRTHRGPLVVQKALHPEGPDVCQAIVLHPPGGIAGGDRLALVVDVGSGAHAQLATPGAAKWYRSAGAPATQALTARVGAGAVLEWLPHEAVVFDGARAELATTIALAGDAVYLGWDIVCLGRTRSGERFARGRWRQRVEVVRDGVLIWTERADIAAGSALLASPVGLYGAPMFGTFVVAAPVLSDELVRACRGVAADSAGNLAFAVTRLPGVLVARCRGESAEDARRWFTALWTVARPAVTGRVAQPLRIWST
jgi:urease accessory protein